MRTALVTGATGYIGSRLSASLLDSGWQVNAVTRASSSLGLLAGLIHEIHFHEHDGTTDSLCRILENVRPDVTFHLACSATADHGPADVKNLIESNVLFGSQLLEAMRQSGSPCIVNAESFWQYSEHVGNLGPTCLYAAAKQAFHDILRYYIQSGHAVGVCLVLYDTYGPDDPRPKLLPFLRKAALSGSQVDLTPGHQIVDMSHIDDVVAAFLRAADLLLAQEVDGLSTYAVSSPQRMTLRDLVELFVRETGLALEVKWGARKYRPNEVMVPATGAALPGWRPAIDLAQGLRVVFGG
jgi:nucleoside-diphosphate-sugar epimerase